MRFLNASDSMVDYLHLELVRTLANDDAEVLGEGLSGCDGLAFRAWPQLRRSCGVAASAQSLEAIADRYRKTPNAVTRAAVLRYAERHRNDHSGALALLLLGATEDDQRQFGDALTHLKAAGKRLPELADYVAYLSAVAEAGLRQFNDTEAALRPVWQSTPASALVTKAVLLQAESYMQGGNPGGAVTLVQQHLADLSTPQAELLLARAYEAQSDGDAAAQHYQKIFVEYPLSPQASDAEAALTRYPGPRARGFVCSRPEARSWRGLHASGQGTHGAAAALER